MKARQSGFTLIEIAIVLVIIGLLLGGVLKGQELIQSARVRNIIAQQDGIKAAYFGFQDRYPGDYPSTLAQQNIPGSAAIGCTVANTTCQDGKINDTNEAESIFAWYQLSKAGFITGTYTGVGTTPTADNSPSNPFGGFMQMIYDNVYEAAGQAALNIKTGTNVPASLLAEVDRKIDDGSPEKGVFRYSSYNSADSACITGSAGSKSWNSAGDIKNCGGATIF